jgi:hypothetical protein
MQPCVSVLIVIDGFQLIMVGFLRACVEVSGRSGNNTLFLMNSLVSVESEERKMKPTGGDTAFMVEIFIDVKFGWATVYCLYFTYFE